MGFPPHPREWFSIIVCHDRFLACIDNDTSGPMAISLILLLSKKYNRFIFNPMKLLSQINGVMSSNSKFRAGYKH